MGDWEELNKAIKEVVKVRREKRAAHWEPILQAKGATFKSEGIWEYNGWLCYPTKGFGMLKKKNRVRRSLGHILQEAQNGDN